MSVAVSPSTDGIGALESRRSELRAEEGQLDHRTAEIARQRQELELRLEAASSVEALRAAEDELADLARELRVIENRRPRLVRELRVAEEELVKARRDAGTALVAEAMVAADVPLQRILEAIEEIEALRRAAVEAGAPEHLLPGVHQMLNGARTTTSVATFALCDRLAERIRGEWRQEALPAARAALVHA